jgi:hypothetical protein
MATQVLALVSTAIFLLGSMNPAWGQSKPAPARPAIESRAQKAGPPTKENMSPQEVAAMSADLQRMRVLLNQMQTNLAFVQATTTPLKHQFELEIDMWQILVNQMERRVASMRGNASSTDSLGAKPER